MQIQSASNLTATEILWIVDAYPMVWAKDFEDAEGYTDYEAFDYYSNQWYYSTGYDPSEFCKRAKELGIYDRIQ